jgi:uncharacterized membrane protein
MTTLDYKIISRPNCSLTTQGRIKLFMLLAVIPLIVGAGFLIIGMWMIFPFIGLELLALAYAFYYIDRHAGDYESISIEGDKLLIEKHINNQTRQFELNTYWAKLVLYPTTSGNLHLYLRSRGVDLEVGKFMNNDQREALAMQLKKRLAVTHL